MFRFISEHRFSRNGLTLRRQHPTIGCWDIQNGDITKGQITVDGDDITNLSPPKIVEKGIAQVLEGRRIFSELNVVENLRLGGNGRCELLVLTRPRN